MVYLKNCQKACGLEQGREPGDEAGEAGRGLLGLSRELGVYSRWDGTPLWFAVASMWESTGGWSQIQTRDDGGLDQCDGSRKEEGLDLRDLSETEQIGDDWL